MFTDYNVSMCELLEMIIWLELHNCVRTTDGYEDVSQPDLYHILT